MDGRSLVPLLEGGSLASPHAGILLRTAAGGAVDAGWGLRTRRYSYLIDLPKRGDRELELYDTQRDPLQLRNLLHGGRPSAGGVPKRYRILARRLDERLRLLRRAG